VKLWSEFMVYAGVSLWTWYWTMWFLKTWGIL